MSNIFTKALASGLGQIMGAMRRMVHPGQPLAMNRLLARTRHDYRREIGDGLDSSVVTAPIMWIQRALPEATLAMREKKAGGEIEELDEHPVIDLIQNPNPFYGDIALWGATVWSMLWDGNAYWLKVRNGAGRVTELWWVPPWMIEPKDPYDGSEFVAWYDYTPGTGMGRMAIAPEDVVHFRNGLNPRDPRKGLSPIGGVIREIFTDLEASNFVASLLRNMGVPGVVISPKSSAMPAAEDVEATKVWFKQAFGGDNRGQPLVMGAPTDVSSFGFNPQQMNLSEGRDVAEERVCACIGVPAAVVGFGAGLQQTKVGATMEELRKLAWHNGVLPLGRQLADELQRSLLPDFERNDAVRRRLKLYWDTSDVLALQEDENSHVERKLREFSAGAITHFEYLAETGREPEDRHRYYLRPFNLIEMREDQIGREPSQPAISPSDAEADPDQSSGTRQMVEEDEAKVGTPKSIKALPAPQTKHSEDWLPDDASDASPEAIERGMAFVELQRRQEAALLQPFEQALTPVFESWGDEAGRIAVMALRARGEKSQAKSDDSLIQQIIDLLQLEMWTAQLSARYQAQYLAVVRAIAEAIEESGFGTGIPDLVQRQVIAQGGRRVGLIDLDGQTRQAVFDALAEGRAAGEGAQALANRIANMVEGGRWGDAQTRARVIARTETKHAQNISTIAGARANGVMQMVTFDGIFGEPRSELSHIARSGKIVSIEAAQIMTENMRPNCTLSFAPHFGI